MGTSLGTFRSGTGATVLLQPSSLPAGADVTINIPSETRCRLIAFSAKLTTSSTSGGRSPLLRFTIQGNITLPCQPASTVVVSSVKTLHWFPGAIATINPAASNTYNMPMPPDIMLQAGDQITTFTDFLQPGDQWSEAFALVEQWIDAS